MARKINRLSARGLPGIKKVGRHADGGNLYLSIAPNGGRRWTFLFRWRGKPTEIGLGSARDVSLARARELATAARAALAAGLDPRTVRNAGEGSTFGEMADALIASMESGWRNGKHRAQWKMTLAEYAKPLRSLDVAGITTTDVLAVLQPIWQSRPETASRVRGRIERVLDFAKVKGKRTGENVARWKGNLEHTLTKPEKLSRGHHAALPYAEMPAFWKSLAADTSDAAQMLRFIILTACRYGEARGLEPGEIKADLWVIPKGRTKGGREHTVPLVDAALREIPFRPVSGPTLAKVIRRHTSMVATTHGMRSTFRDWAGDATDFPRELAESALAHVLGEVERAYRRGTALAKRRELMMAWAAYCGGA